MGMGLKRSTEDSRPLVHTKSSSPNAYTPQTMSDGYVNEAICDPDKFISTRFGDSCRQSLTDLKSTQCIQEQNEFSYHKSFLRKTCSGKLKFCVSGYTRLQPKFDKHVNIIFFFFIRTF